MSRFNLHRINKEKGEIWEKMGYQFTLLDHWTLYDSMMHSSYLMIKLSLWGDKGVNILNELLSTIGISQVEAKQLYKFMTR
jgi:cell division control protein 45